MVLLILILFFHHQFAMEVTQFLDKLSAEEAMCRQDSDSVGLSITFPDDIIPDSTIVSQNSSVSCFLKIHDKYIGQKSHEAEWSITLNVDTDIQALDLWRRLKAIVAKTSTVELDLGSLGRQASTPRVQRQLSTPRFSKFGGIITPPPNVIVDVPSKIDKPQQSLSAGGAPTIPNLARMTPDTTLETEDLDDTQESGDSGLPVIDEKLKRPSSSGMTIALSDIKSISKMPSPSRMASVPKLSKLHYQQSNSRRVVGKLMIDVMDRCLKDAINRLTETFEDYRRTRVC